MKLFLVVLALALLANHGMTYSVGQISALRDGSEAALNAVNVVEKMRDMAKDLIGDVARFGGRGLTTQDRIDIGDVVAISLELSTCLQTGAEALVTALTPVPITNVTGINTEAVSGALIGLGECFNDLNTDTLNFLVAVITDITTSVPISGLIMPLIQILLTLLSGVPGLGALGGLLGGLPLRR